jgi:hypothetical protein
MFLSQLVQYVGFEIADDLSLGLPQVAQATETFYDILQILLD